MMIFYDVTGKCESCCQLLRRMVDELWHFRLSDSEVTIKGVRRFSNDVVIRQQAHHTIIPFDPHFNPTDFSMNVERTEGRTFYVRPGLTGSF